MELIGSLGTSGVLLMFLIGLFAGLVKGAVGFAMPTILISGLSSFLPVDIALGVLMLPTLATNLAQALRQGLDAAWQTIRRFRVFLIVGFVCLVTSAQLVPVLAPRVLFLAIGIPVTIFAALQLFRWRLRVRPEKRRRAEVAMAAIAGSIGGVSGVWGPPTVLYLTAIDAPKRDSVRAQGVIYGLGALALMSAHLMTGVVSSTTLPASALMLIPAGIGMWFGFRVQDRLDQERFRQLTLFVLVIAGLNLVRRGLV